MEQNLIRRNTNLHWIGQEPNNKNNVALIIPQYNEGASTNFEKRLEYFYRIATQFSDMLDVIIVDDGSTDDSLERIVDYYRRMPNCFFLSTVQPNANKVGALYLAIRSIRYRYVIMTDFDTDLVGLSEIPKITELLDADPNLMGCYFRMLPFEGSGMAFLFQQLEYSLARSLYKLHMSEQTIPVMPGAGSCYKREILVSIFASHSGLRSGEDRESTIIGQKLGFKAIYAQNIASLTRPPLSFKALLKQRRRWNLGYLETINKERGYYYHQITKMNLIGIRTLIDALLVILSLLFPFAILIVSTYDWQVVTALVAICYSIAVGWCLTLINLSTKESIEFKDKRLFSILYYPLYKFLVDLTAWSTAIFDFIRKKTRISDW